MFSCRKEKKSFNFQEPIFCRQGILYAKIDTPPPSSFEACRLQGFCGVKEEAQLAAGRVLEMSSKCKESQ